MSQSVVTRTPVTFADNDELSAAQYINLYGRGPQPPKTHYTPERIVPEFDLTKKQVSVENRPAVIYPQKYLVSLANQPNGWALSRYLFEEWGTDRMDKEVYSRIGAEHSVAHLTRSSHECLRLPDYKRSAYAVVQIAQMTRSQPVSSVRNFLYREGYNLAGARELVAWIEQHGDRFEPQARSVCFRALAVRGRQHKKTEVEPAYGGGYSHSSYRAWLQICGNPNVEEKPWWKACSKKAIGDDPHVGMSSYFLVSPAHGGGPTEPPDQYVPETGW